MNRFTTILWDLDGTLLDFQYSQTYALTKCFRDRGREISEEQIERYSRINEAFWKRHELGEITREQLQTERFRQLFQEYNIRDIDLEPFQKEFEEALGSVVSHKDDSLTICKSLHGHMRQYVVTNGSTAIQRNKLKLSGFLETMDGVFISEEIGAPKPGREFFEYCLERVEEKERSRILIVGDSLSSDIRGGIQTGIATCWYRPEEAVNDTPFQPDHEISDLHMLYDILGVFDTWQSRRDKN